jgi:putative Holliday junction resolvase
MDALPPKTLALDYGTRRIGVAVNYGTLVEPLEVVGNKAGAEALEGVVTPGALARIKTLCKEHAAQQLVIGVSENQMAEMTQKFIELVQAECQLPVLPWDETLSSVVVKSRLKEARMSQRQPHAAIDHYAAATILEDWLESQ